MNDDHEVKLAKVGINVFLLDRTMRVRDHSRVNSKVAPTNLKGLDFLLTQITGTISCSSMN